MNSTRNCLVVAFCFSLVGLTSAVPGVAQEDEPGAQVIVSGPVVPVLTRPAREAPPFEVVAGPPRDINPRQHHRTDFDPDFTLPGGPDPLLPLQEAAPPAAPDAFGTPLFNFDGQGYTFLNPPDTVGDVGTNHFVQMINGGGTGVAVYAKATGMLLSSFALTSLGGCATGSGDPVVLYDQPADRWLLSEFGAGNSLCVFVSQTPDPLGAYFSYQFTTPSFPDYPKYGVWSDAYYVTANEATPSAYALNRASMLAGAPATSLQFTVPSLSGFGFQALTPNDLDGATPPPAGAPAYFMRHRDTEAHGPAGLPASDILEIWAFHVDFAVPANSTFTQLPDITTAEFDSDLCGFFSFSCMGMPGVPQGSVASLDPLREVIMHRLAYRNFGTHETLVGNFVTDVTGMDQGGVRWFELRKVGAGAWSLYQEGTYAPDADNRWMGAIAMDGVGNIALGYNVSSQTVFPSLRYAGRLATDPLGTLPQGEFTLATGAAVNGSNRYGDYSAMSVDPVDDCTFWFTGEWNATSQWSTRIGAFKFDACGPTADLQITKTDGVATAVPGTATIYTIVASNLGPSADPAALVTDTFPAACTSVNWTCAGAGGGSCPAGGAGNINATVNLPVGGSATFIATCAISPAATGTLVNTATVAPGPGVADLVPGNNSATDTDSLSPQADVSVVKTADPTALSSGDTVTFTIVVGNAGPSDVLGVLVEDYFPVEFQPDLTWTCTGQGGGSCTAAGVGDIVDVVNLPAGASVTYVATCSAFSATAGDVTNTASVTLPAGVIDPVPSNQNDSVTVTIDVFAIQEIPTLDRRGLALLLLLLGIAGWLVLRRTH